jgi:hypothetical protein
MKELKIEYQDLLLLQVQNPLAIVSCLAETLHFQRKKPCVYLEKISLARDKTKQNHDTISTSRHTAIEWRRYLIIIYLRIIIPDFTIIF